VRLLIADDAAALRELFGGLARALGHDVVAEAADADEAERLARALQPDVAVVDGRLVPGQASRVIAGLRAAAPRAAILVVASLTESALVRASVTGGADGALLRPYTLSGLEEALRACASRAQR
jgi:DNA-binding NarL/FixJ family response regulator